MKHTILVALLLQVPCLHAQEVRRITDGAVLLEALKGDRGWGLRLDGKGATLRESEPLQIELDSSPGQVHRAAYGEVVSRDGVLTARGAVVVGSVRFEFSDIWRVEGQAVRLDRNVSVRGSMSGGFVSAATLRSDRSFNRADVHLFVPGMMYGGPENLTKSAIGGSDSFTGGREPELRIREDRMPAPLFGLRFADGDYVAVLDASPKAESVIADTRDLKAATVIDERMRFGALGLTRASGTPAIGCWFPGMEGERTYAGGTYPGGQLHQWRRRYHPIRDGLTQHYELAFRFGASDSLQSFYRDAWRWAWSVLQPRVRPHDLEVVRRSLTDMMVERVEKTADGRFGIPNFIESAEVTRADRKAVMGFTGKNLEAAEFLLVESLRDGGTRSARLRAAGEAIFDSFVKLKMSPPEGEGFHLDSGATVLAIPHDNVVYLRSFGDDIKATLRAIRREKAAGRPHDAWLAWCREFGDWLLTQQQPQGGFPRSWRPRTGEVADASPESTYNAIPLLVLLSQQTGDPRYLGAATQAGEFAWQLASAKGKFVGGTIDNPDVIDKEAGTLSLEAYLALYEATKEDKWLRRAQVAAEFAETWIYTWNVPMPAEEDAAELHWKPGVPTVGLQLISSGHSLVDEYMAFDADEFAKLSRYTGDSHYLDVARLLLHNTKSMLAIPDRTYDLKGPGWQQEHWSLAPFRGRGLHRGWLPWVSTSHLNGIIGLEEFDPGLFRRLAQTAEAEPLTRAELIGEMNTKLARVQGFLQREKLGGVLLSLVRNVSWLTAGMADSHIVITSEMGAASLLVMNDGKRYVLASNSEMARLLAEDLRGLGFEPREFKWYADKTATDERLRMIREIAGSRTIGTDSPAPGLREIESVFAPLRYVLTETEIQKYRWLGRNATEAVASVCRRIRPGLTEREMEAMASDELLRRGIRPTVLLMGADERVFSYRHTVPSDKPLNRYAFVNVCARRWGLVVSTGRFVHFGPVPEELRKRVRASAQVAANYLAATKPGVTAGSILEQATTWFADAGFPGELELHHQGGAIGYAEREWIAFPGSRELIQDNQAFAWNPIVQGALSFDTFVLHNGRMENMSEIEDWPKIEVSAGGAVYRLPDILVR